MANWSRETWYVQGDGQELMKRLRFTEDDPRFYFQYHEFVVGAHWLLISGSGRHHGPNTICGEFWEEANRRAVVGFCGYDTDPEESMYIMVNGEVVLRQTRGCADESPWTRFVGGTAEQRLFFTELWRKLDSDCSMERDGALYRSYVPAHQRKWIEARAGLRSLVWRDEWVADMGRDDGT
jgi:hypothetical protein